MEVGTVVPGVGQPKETSAARYPCSFAEAAKVGLEEPAASEQYTSAPVSLGGSGGVLPRSLVEKIEMVRRKRRQGTLTVEDLESFSPGETKQLSKNTRQSYRRMINHLKRKAEETGEGPSVPKAMRAMQEETPASEAAEYESDPLQEMEVQQQAERSANLEETDSKIPIFDAHFHLDRSFQKIRRSAQIYNNGEPSFNLSVLLNECGSTVPDDVQLLGAVASFCDLTTMSLLEIDGRLRKYLEDQEDLKLCFGLHPNHARKLIQSGKVDEAVRTVSALSAMKNVVALGEIGLDLYQSAENFKKGSLKEQERLLHKVLSGNRDLLEKGLPVVIHCREASRQRQGARFRPIACDRLIVILKSYLDQGHKVYVHFFVGGRKEVEAWKAAFPNVVFGLVVREGGRSHLQDDILETLSASGN